MAGSAGGKNEGSTSSSEWTLVLSLILILATLVGIWYFARAPLVYTVFAMKWVEIHAYDLVMGLGARGRSYLDFITGVFDGRREARDIKFSEFQDVATAVGAVVRMPIVAIIGALGVAVLLKMKGNGFKNSYKLNDFIRYQSMYWKTLAMSASFNPDAPNANMAPSAKPGDWMKKHGIQLVVDGNNKLFGDNRDLCVAVLRRQLGESWKGMKKLPLHARCIIAICITHAERKRDNFEKNVGLRLREEIATIWAFEKDAAKRTARLEELIAPIFKDAKRLEKIEEFAKEHAYIATVLIRVLNWSREEAGVLATAEFLWLKEQDRVLYYTLNTAGRRRRAFIECSGVWSHYYHERVLNRPIIDPQVEQAMVGIESYIFEQGIGDIEGETAAAAA